MGHDAKTKATAAATKVTDSELGIELLEGAQADSGYPVADGIWLLADGTFAAEEGTVHCNLRLRPFVAA